ncbi:MAG: GntR family transcriptional regulator [Pseudomonadota bacterium]
MAKAKQTDAVEALLLGWIDKGQLLPGAAIDEAGHMAACSVSRTPVREALIRLEALGLLVRHPRKGVHLFRPDVSAFLAILEVHSFLEAQATGLAAQRLSPMQRRALEESVAACQMLAKSHAMDRHADYDALNMRFHEIIAEAAQNACLLETSKLNARKVMTQYRLRYRMPGAIEASATEHAGIAAHILGGRSQEAQEAMLKHFNYDQETVMQMIASIG